MPDTDLAELLKRINLGVRGVVASVLDFHQVDIADLGKLTIEVARDDKRGLTCMVMDQSNRYIATAWPRTTPPA